MLAYKHDIILCLLFNNYLKDPTLKYELDLTFDRPKLHMGIFLRPFDPLGVRKLVN